MSSIRRAPGLAVLWLVANLSSSALAGGVHIGNGGDPRAIIIRKARVEAVNFAAKLEVYNEMVLSQLRPTGTAKKFLESPALIHALASDILNSDHFYDLEASRPTCAWTNDPDPKLTPPGLNTIRFSLPLCGPLFESKGRSFAIHILIHESVHHLLRDAETRKMLGVSFSGGPEQRYEQEEIVCDEIAMTVISAFEVIAQAGIPHWTNLSVPEKLEERGFHSAAWTGETGDARSANKMLIWGGCRETENAIYGCARYLNDGALYSPEDDNWTKITQENAPEGRIEHAAIWAADATNSQHAHKFFVWGGCADGDACTRYLNSGGIYDPATDHWVRVADRGHQPSPRSNHSVVWTGDQYLVWGGSVGVHTPGQLSRALADGGAYDPEAKAWSRIPEAEFITAEGREKFSPRSYHTAIWTGETGNPVTAYKMLIWGGCDFEEGYFCREYFGDGALYDPKTQLWTKLQTAGMAPSPRRLHSAVHVAEHQSLIIWGGERKNRKLNDGAYLDLRTLVWRTMANPAPEKRSRHSAVWTGDVMIVFGGESDLHSYADDIGIYRLPVSGTGPGRWEPIAPESIRLHVKNHTAVWSPKGMIVWGGQTDLLSFANMGAVFVPGEF